MKMSSSFVIRLGIWCVLMLYLFLDLILFEGPLKQQVYRLQGSRSEKLGNDIERGIVARVFAKPILLTQVDYAVDEHLWRSGRTRMDVSAKQRKEIREVVLRELCDHSLLREKVALNQKEFPVSDEEINAAMRRFASRFKNIEVLAQSMTAFGFQGEKELRFRIAARLQQNKYIEAHIARGIAVTGEEARAWYAAHPEELTTPARVKARQIYLTAAGHTDEQATKVLNAALEKLQNKATTFDFLASELSEDERSKKIGGQLGWMTKQRLPEDFSTALFELPLNTPSIIQTKLGHHLVEVTEKSPAVLSSFEKLKPEIVAALETSRRKSAVLEYRRNLRLQHPDKIVIHEQLLSSPWTN